MKLSILKGKHTLLHTEKQKNVSKIKCCKQKIIFDGLKYSTRILENGTLSRGAALIQHNHFADKIYLELFCCYSILLNSNRPSLVLHMIIADMYRYICKQKVAIQLCMSAVEDSRKWIVSEKKESRDYLNLTKLISLIWNFLRNYLPPATSTFKKNFNFSLMLR